MVNKKKKFIQLVLSSSAVLFALFSIFGVSAGGALAQSETGASLYLAPAGGSYAVDDTFSVSVYVNTAGRAVNAVEADIIFPPDKLQIVSPSVGKSVIGVWVGQPNFSNVSGTISFRGAIPNPGLNVTQGLVSTFTFRVKSTGKAVVTFTDASKVLLNDGKATDVLANTSGAIFDLVLPPPQGPIVISETNPDQSKWYQGDSAVFAWQSGGVDDLYSFVLDQEPISIPDNIPEPNRDGVAYSNLDDGIRYFHIKARRDDVWGGVTHYAIRIDKSVPAVFSPVIEPSSVTANHRPIILFDTTDANSGIDHYELKIIPLSISSSVKKVSRQDFFIESTSPYIPELDTGKYDLIVRAFDQAGNFREVKSRINILPESLAFIAVLIPTTWLGFLLLIILLLVSAYLSRRYYLRHLSITYKHAMGALADKSIEAKIAKLKEYQKKYGQLVMLLFVIGIATFGSINSANADTRDSVVAPPSITTIAENISNQELFYIGGRYSIPGGIITIFLQRESGETSSYLAVTDKKGDWFYSMTSFLPSGSYIVWTQAQVGNISSPPSAQIKLEVETTAIALGSTRLSFQFVYGVLTIILTILTTFLLLRALYYYYASKRKHSLLVKEIEEAEASVHRGFAIIRRDIRAELDSLKRLKMSSKLRLEEEKKEEQLLKDLALIEETVGKEVWDIKQYI